jgi:hypothetical protein
VAEVAVPVGLWLEILEIFRDAEVSIFTKIITGRYPL